MGACFKDECAIELVWEGRKGRPAFKGSQLMRVVERKYINYSYSHGIYVHLKFFP